MISLRDIGPSLAYALLASAPSIMSIVFLRMLDAGKEVASRLVAAHLDVPLYQNDLAWFEQELAALDAGDH